MPNYDSVYRTFLHTLNNFMAKLVRRTNFGSEPNLPRQYHRLLTERPVVNEREMVSLDLTACSCWRVLSWRCPNAPGAYSNVSVEMTGSSRAAV